jgi:HEAT repeat protein
MGSSTSIGSRWCKSPSSVTALVCGCFALLPYAAHASTIDALIAQLAGPDEQARAHARQFLPRHGVDALPVLLPLIDHESEHVWRAAYNVVADIANQASAPGREADRVRAADFVAQWLAPEQTPRAHEYGLRLIGYVVPPNYSVHAIIPFLDYPNLRDYARAALELSATDQARNALEQALANPDPDFQIALLRSLETINDPQSLPVLLSHMQNVHAAIRAAAARAAAPMAGPRHVREFRDVPARATAGTQFAATDAFLRYADALARSGGNWGLAIQLFAEILDASSEPVLQSAAMMGLGRFGDESAVTRLVDATSDNPSAAVQQAFPLALRALEGNAAVEAILAHYPRIPQHLRPSVLRLLGEKPHPAVATLIADNLHSPDPATRDAALAAAAALASRLLLAPLMTMVETGPEPQQRAALTVALKIARTANEAGGDEAGPALVRLYGRASDDATRLKILAALAHNPSLEALPLTMEAAGTPALAPAAVPALVALLNPLQEAGRHDELREVFAKIMHLNTSPDPAVAVPTLVALLKPLHAAGRHEEVREVFAKIMQLNSSPDAVVAVVTSLGPAAKDYGLVLLLGVIQDWHIIGPFPWNQESDWEQAFVAEPHVDLKKPVAIDGNQIAWQKHTSQDAFGIINLIDALGPTENAFAYAHALFEAPRAEQAQLRIGSDDGVVAWVNGEKVWDNRIVRGLGIDQDSVPIQLRSGQNAVLLKISQGAGGWAFCARITDTAGAGISRK